MGKKKDLSRRAFLGASAALFAAPRVFAQEQIVWRNVQDWGVEGRGWSETARYFDRLPAKAEKLVRPAVWGLSRHSSGMLVRFETDAARILVRYALLNASLALPHMPATGVSGVDLYAVDGQGRDRWVSVSKPAAQKVDAELVRNLDRPEPGKKRLCSAYLPLYNGVEALEIGVPTDAAFAPAAPRKEKPILFYGTSIMHGACASRPGMAIPAILGRRLNRPTINLGFSGNGIMEPEVADLLAELDPCLYAIDCLPNMNPQQVAERAEPLVRKLRNAHPETPILLVEDRSFTSAAFFKERREGHEARRAELRKAHAKLVADGMKGLGYLEGEGLLGADGEAATDGSHPSDLGFMRYADAYEPAIRKLLG
jgi:hypothetical protein